MLAMSEFFSVSRFWCFPSNTRAVHFAPWYRNQMDVEFSKELAGRLTMEKTGLQVAAKFVSDEELLKNYLNRPYGNAYDFDQIEQIEGIF